MGILRKLVKGNGTQAVDPPAITRTVFWDAAEAIARAYDDDGNETDQLRFAKVEWIHQRDMRFTGMSFLDELGGAPRLQVWDYSA